ncbi:MAG: helix-turn-helix transcriptional regulator [Planctomycetes bacterium]|nr:helix-turn-helix transcriptional regulator [Planctomycetota bacterium]
MSVDDLPNLDPPELGRVVDAARPILSFSWTREGPHRVAKHSHPRAHIVCPDRGAVWASTDVGTWLVPTGQALWIPSGLHHEVYSRGAVSARMIFVDPAHAATLPRRCGTVVLTALLDQLVLRALEHGNRYPPEGPGARLAQVMLDELRLMKSAPYVLPGARDPRLLRALRRASAEPSADLRIEDAAVGSGASVRTLARLFARETGMTFTQWKTRLLVVEAIDRLARGFAVGRVAYDLGYRSTSGFVYMFRRSVGHPPGAYRALQARTS